MTAKPRLDQLRRLVKGFLLKKRFAVRQVPHTILRLNDSVYTTGAVYRAGHMGNRTKGDNYGIKENHYQ